MNNKLERSVYPLILALSVFLSACGGGDSSGDDGSPTGTNETETIDNNTNNNDPVISNAKLFPTDGFPNQFDSNITYSQHLYVSPNGNDIDNDGLSAGTPLLTIQSAVEIAMQQYPDVPVQVNIGAGVYGNDPNNYIILRQVNRTATTPIALVGETGPEGQLLTHIEGSINFDNQRNGLHIMAGRYVVIDSLRITGYANAIHIDDYAYRAEAQRFNDPTMATHFIIRNSHITAYKDPNPARPQGNNDAIKLSGVNNFLLLNNILETGGQRGSGVDAVGCHDGVITGNLVQGIIDVPALDPTDPNSIGGSGIQTKGSSANILIHGNIIRDFNPYGGRAINAGGGTNPYLHRPSLIPESRGINREAYNIQIISNVISNNFDAVAFPNCVDCVLANNTIVGIAQTRDPVRQGRAIRLLNENARPLVIDPNQIIDMELGETILIAPTENIKIYNNIFRYAQADVRQGIQAQTDVEANALTLISNNLWWIHDADENARPQIGSDLVPITTEMNDIYQIDPGFVDSDFRIGISSPVVGLGAPAEHFSLDLDLSSFNENPSIGAFEPQ